MGLIFTSLFYHEQASLFLIIEWCPKRGYAVFAPRLFYFPLPSSPSRDNTTFMVGRGKLKRKEMI